MELRYIILCILFAMGKHESAPVQSNTDSPTLFAIDYMKNFGYLEKGTSDSDALYNKSAITEALKNLQKFGNIPVTGELDNATLKLMSLPRCGIPDIPRTDTFDR